MVYLTILPYYLFIPGFPPLEVFTRPQVFGNLLFLGCLASMVCFLTWNWCISRAGYGKGHQLGLLQPYHHHDFRLVGTWLSKSPPTFW